MKYQPWSLLAEDAEKNRDWERARECWYRAAENLDGNPRNLRTEYNRREDAADQNRRAALIGNE